MMGCLHSKDGSTDLHPNVFRVVNINENGADLCSGQLEITDTDIVLYREGRDSTVWPLHSLRRYGFEAEIFSFESGRRCETGEGIYAFRCRRASLLFQTLQQQIQQRNVNQDVAPYPSTPYPVARLTPNLESRQTMAVNNGQSENLRPLVNNTHLSNLTQTGPIRNANSVLRSSSGDILESMRLYPRSQSNGTQATNVYQLRDFKREHNNNQNDDSQPVYCNDLNRDLAMLRKTMLWKDTTLELKTEIDDDIHKNINTFVSPTLSNSSEHYAKLSLEQQESIRMYMNVNLNETQLHDIGTVPSTPLTPKQVEYYNLPIGTNTYANLSLGELGGSSKNVKQGYSEYDSFMSMSPVEELEVNYAVLDIDGNRERKPELTSPEIKSYNSSINNSMASSSSQSRSRLISQCSVEKTPMAIVPLLPPNTVGYTTIDFDKTVALTSVASTTDVDVDGHRKTRHNSCNLVCSSPITERNKQTYT